MCPPPAGWAVVGGRALRWTGRESASRRGSRIAAVGETQPDALDTEGDATTVDGGLGFGVGGELNEGVVFSRRGADGDDFPCVNVMFKWNKYGENVLH